MNRPIYIIFLIISIMTMSFLISYGEEDFEFPNDIQELENMLEKAETEGDTKLIKKLNKRINHLNWKEEKEIKNTVKEHIAVQLEDAEASGDTDLVNELKAELKLAVRDSIRSKFLNTKEGKMPFGLVKDFKREKRSDFSKVEWFEKKQKFFKNHNNEKRLQQILKQIEKFKQLEEMKENNSNKGLGNSK